MGICNSNTKVNMYHEPSNSKLIVHVNYKNSIIENLNKRDIQNDIKKANDIFNQYYVTEDDKNNTE